GSSCCRSAPLSSAREWPGGDSIEELSCTPAQFPGDSTQKRRARTHRGEVLERALGQLLREAPCPVDSRKRDEVASAVRAAALPRSGGIPEDVEEIVHDLVSQAQVLRERYQGPLLCGGSASQQSAHAHRGDEEASGLAAVDLLHLVERDTARGELQVQCLSSDEPCGPQSVAEPAGNLQAIPLRSHRFACQQAVGEVEQPEGREDRRG